MALKHFIEILVLFSVVTFVFSLHVNSQLSRNSTADDISGVTGSYLALNLSNVTLNIDSLNGNRINIVQKYINIDQGSNTCNNTGSEGVFWRPWNGTIPKDAIVGGIDQKNNVSVYMGQMALLYEHNNLFGGMQPVRIYKDSVDVTAFFHKIHNGNKNVNILCASDPDLVSWNLVSRVDKKNSDLVVAGVENDSNGTLFFGRMIYNNELIIGKVSPDEDMYFPYNNEEIGVGDDNFEILTYSGKR